MRADQSPIITGKSQAKPQESRTKICNRKDEQKMSDCTRNDALESGSG
jgi:hypothetical protein